MSRNKPHINVVQVVLDNGGTETSTEWLRATEILLRIKRRKENPFPADQKDGNNSNS